jgi:hypothetical protein
MARTSAIESTEGFVPYHGAPEGAVPYHALDGRPMVPGGDIPHVSDTPWKPSYHDLPQCNGTSRVTRRRCGSKVQPGEEFCEHHREQ